MKARFALSRSAVSEDSTVPLEIINRIEEPFTVEQVSPNVFRVLDPDRSLHGWFLTASSIKVDHPT